MIWKVPKIWEGGECWIIGGGPSVTQQFGIPAEVVQKVVAGELTPEAYSPYLSILHTRHVIGVNVAYRIGTWMDMIFSGDGGFYLKHREALATYPTLTISCAEQKQNEKNTDGIKVLARDKNRSRGISRDPRMVSWNGNSGAAAISVAAHTGVKRILLLGFDMRLSEDGDQHWHRLYKRDNPPKPRRPSKLPFDRHMLGFEAIAKDADKMGIEILNISPDSAIKELKKVSLRDVL